MKMNLTSNQTNPSPTPTVWSIELPQRLYTWKRTANAPWGRVNSKEYRNHKKALRDFFGLSRVPRWGDAWVELEIHVDLVGEHAHGDWDNYGKIISDSLQDLLYDDDRQVIGGHVYKHLHAETPCVRIGARKLPHELALPGLAPRFTEEPVPGRPVPGEIYCHHKGGWYIVLSVGEVDMTHGGEVVRYASREDGKRYVRSLSEFTEVLEDGRPRFRLGWIEHIDEGA